MLQKTRDCDDMLLKYVLPGHYLILTVTMSQQNKLQTMIKCYCKQTSTWKQSHPPDPPDSASPPQRTLRQISGDITFQEYLQVFVLVYQRFLLGLKLYFSKVRAWIFT